MKRSTERILTTHVGSLVRPPGLIDSCGRRKTARPMTKGELAVRVRSAVQEVVQKQVAKSGWTSPATVSMANPASLAMSTNVSAGSNVARATRTRALVELGTRSAAISRVL